jgi:hypothetical protein
LVAHAASASAVIGFTRLAIAASKCSRSCRAIRLPSRTRLRRTSRQVWTAPSWQGSSRRRFGSVLPCVRPVCAVHMTAGHNALRGSGPDQKPAFEMHWHEWVVLTAVRPLTRPGSGTARPWPSWPTPFGRVYWQARSPQPWRRYSSRSTTSCNAAQKCDVAVDPIRASR